LTPDSTITACSATGVDTDSDNSTLHGLGHLSDNSTDSDSSLDSSQQRDEDEQKNIRPDHAGTERATWPIARCSSGKQCNGPVQLYAAQVEVYADSAKPVSLHCSPQRFQWAMVTKKISMGRYSLIRPAELQHGPTAVSWLPARPRGWRTPHPTPDSVSRAQALSETRSRSHGSRRDAGPFPSPETFEAQSEVERPAPTTPPAAPKPQPIGGGDVADLCEDQRGGVAHMPLPRPHHRDRGDHGPPPRRHRGRTPLPWSPPISASLSVPLLPGCSTGFLLTSNRGWCRLSTCSPRAGAA
jgi:hypothetical protein